MSVEPRSDVSGVTCEKALIGIAVVALLTQTLVWRAERKLVRD